MHHFFTQLDYKMLMITLRVEVLECGRVILVSSVSTDKERMLHKGLHNSHLQNFNRFFFSCRFQRAPNLTTFNWFDPSSFFDGNFPLKSGLHTQILISCLPLLKLQAGVSPSESPARPGGSISAQTGTHTAVETPVDFPETRLPRLRSWGGGVKVRCGGGRE